MAQQVGSNIGRMCKPEFEAGTLLPTDNAITKGTGLYGIEADKRREERKKKAAK